MHGIPVPPLCPICDLEYEDKKGFADKDAVEITCKRCGRYVMGGDLLRIEIGKNPLTRRRPALTTEDEALLPYLSAYTRQASDQGTVPELDRNNWRDFSIAHKVIPLQQKMVKLLKLIENRSSSLGDEVEIDFALDYPLVGVCSGDEMHYLLEELMHRGYLDGEIRPDGSICSLTITGREFLEQSMKGAVPTSHPTDAPQKREFPFIRGAELRKVLERDYAEIQRASRASCWKAVIILSGGAIEAILTDLLLQNESAAQAATNAPKGKKDITKWDLADLIKVCVELKLVRPGVEKLSHSVREYRNLVHPGNEIRNGLVFDAEEARIALEVLHIIHRDLSI